MLRKVIYEKPKLQSPVMVAGWPGMGLLAKIVADYMVWSLNARLVAEILVPEPRITVKGGVGEMEWGRHQVYVSDAREGGLVIVTGPNQPIVPSEAYELAVAVVEIAKELGVNMIFTSAATMGVEGRPPRVSAIVSSPELGAILDIHGIKLVDDARITGLNGILLGVAKQEGVPAVCLLGEIYYADVPQPLSAKAVLSVLSKIIGVTLDLAPLDKQAKEIEEILETVRERVREAMERGKGEGLTYIS